MPRPKTTPAETKEHFTESLFEEAQQRGWTGGDMITILRRVGALIRTINMAGKKMQNRCRLCPEARLRKVPCPHEEIWELTK